MEIVSLWADRCGSPHEGRGRHAPSQQARVVLGMKQRAHERMEQAGQRGVE